MTLKWTKIKPGTFTAPSSIHDEGTSFEWRIDRAAKGWFKLSGDKELIAESMLFEHHVSAMMYAERREDELVKSMTGEPK